MNQPIDKSNKLGSDIKSDSIADPKTETKPAIKEDQKAADAKSEGKKS